MNKRLLQVLLLVFLFGMGVAKVHAQFAKERGRRVSKGGRLDSSFRRSFFPVEKTIGEIASAPVRANQNNGVVQALRLHFRFNHDQVKQAGQSGTWSITIKDSSGAELWTFDSASDSDFDEFWSTELPVDNVTVIVSSRVPNSVLKLTCDKKIEYLEPVQERSIVGDDNSVEITRVTDSNQLRWARSVARLTFVSTEEDDVLTCTGFVVARTLFITNDHCPRGEKERKSAIVEFDYDFKGAPTKIYRLKAELARNEPLDFAFYELNKPVGDREPLRLLVEDQPLDNKKQLIVIQHPAGLPKRLAAIDCEVKTLASGIRPATDFGHKCDTEGGSSGSPVLNLSGLVVGIHHYGFDPSVSDPALQLNQAVKMKEIIDFIKVEKGDKARKVREFLTISQ